jgi:hypothetical protein
VLGRRMRSGGEHLMPGMILNTCGNQMKDGKGVDHLPGGCPEKPGGPEYVKAIKAARPMARLGNRARWRRRFCSLPGQSLVHYRRDSAVNGGFLLKVSRSREI